MSNGGRRNFLITHDGVSEETAYQMTKLLFENLRRWSPRTRQPRRSTRQGAGTACRFRCIRAERYYKKPGS